MADLKELFTMPAGNLSIEELQKVLGQKKQEEFERRVEEQTKKNKLVIKHIDVLLEMNPKHSGTRCNDVNLGNENNHCLRCLLLSVQKFGYMEVEFDLEMRVINSGLA